MKKFTLSKNTGILPNAPGILEHQIGNQKSEPVTRLKQSNVRKRQSEKGLHTFALISDMQPSHRV
ncbi:hypothetical protein ACNO5M_03095 [Vibrio owensii]|uniref:hypothetical protein n=1 Tax=Vibrio owensii TaxID=696485 RepID=UPI003AAC2E3C